MNTVILFLIEYFFTLLLLYILTSNIIHTNNQFINTVIRGFFVSMLIYIGIVLEAGHLNPYVTLIKFVKGKDHVTKTTILLISQVLALITSLLIIRYYKVLSKVVSKII